ncbi:contact-dependent growth inhibition system immunity protein [Photorhabdus luminescens]|uniref:contact-dependent growth inhibition system immunity protein n=1 Tax=Photorhabdus luminescens TaxID=29488 RepID=UPI002240A771|nr:contact-dependent growth inhibition system immunity protein [Photorhabdus luminescens]MCW7763176.1 contact-dependent growth inhibition system immunity protein [Photorhabdus luminescens subsp. venezuelensis]
MTGQYPFLDILMHAYFNQDFDIISGPELDDVINDFLNDASQGMRKGLIEEISDLIDSSEDVENTFDYHYHDVDVLPEWWGLTALEFLEHVSKKAQDFLNERIEKEV